MSNVCNAPGPRVSGKNITVPRARPSVDKNPGTFYRSSELFFSETEHWVSDGYMKISGRLNNARAAI